MNTSRLALLRLQIIVPLTFIGGRYQSRLLEKVQQQFSDLKITGFSRSAFNKANGMDRIKALCLPECNSVLLTLQHKYYCLSAVSALLLYIENVKNVYYTRESVKVAYEESEDTMIIGICFLFSFVCTSFVSSHSQTYLRRIN